MKRKSKKTQYAETELLRTNAQQVFQITNDGDDSEPRQLCNTSLIRIGDDTRRELVLVAAELDELALKWTGLRAATTNPAHTVKQYYIEHRYAYGWDDAGWQELDGQNRVSVVTYTSQRKAKAELADFLRERKGSHAPEDYRVAVYKPKAVEAIRAKLFKFRPTKKLGNDGVPSEFTNAHRAMRGEKMFRVHPDNKTADLVKGDDEGAQDVLADFFHFCDRQEIDVERVIASAKLHWQTER